MPILHWSPRSPYVRKVMVALHEKGLSERVDTVRTLADPIFPPEGFFVINPLAKIPTLEREGHPPIFDSRVIMEWADMEADTGPVLFPSDPETRLLVLRDEALGTGMIETGVALLIELYMRDKDKQDSRVIDVCRRKFEATLDFLDCEIAQIGARPFDAGQLSIGVALCYFDFRFADLGWRESRPALTHWHEAFCARPSVEATVFRDDARPTD